MSETVDSIRQQIDELDNAIHDLLMDRASLVMRIGEEKRKNKVQVIQPDREAAMIRRLLARHQGPLPKEAVVRIWRELVGAVSLLQTGLKVVVTVPDDHQQGLVYWDMAKDYFSSVLPMQKVANPLAALSQVREHEATFAVLPWPHDEQANPWWGYLMDESGDHGMRVVARLPLGDRVRGEYNPEHRALVVARLRYEASGQDRSFLGLELEESVSKTRVVDRAKMQGLSANSLYTCPASRPGRKIHLLEVEGYIGPADAIIETLFRSFEDPDARCVCLGGYPVPPVYEDRVGKGALADSSRSHTRQTA